MSLDFDKIAEPIFELARNAKVANEEKKQKISSAVSKLKSFAGDIEGLQYKIANSKTTWLVPGLMENIDFHRFSDKEPDDYIILATDGSHIDVDRHQSIRCFLINVGLIKLQYGTEPDAELTSTPVLYFKDEDVSITLPDGKQVMIEGQLLGLKRTIEECRVLQESVAGCNKELPVIALIDGSLILWGLIGQQYDEFILDEMVVKGFINCLDQLKDLSEERTVALASYISYPRSTEVINVLKVAICPHELADCDKYCDGKLNNRDCDIVNTVIDRDIFNALLERNERSAIFKSRSSIIDKYYKGNTICFFYLKLENEIARIEIPQWVADRKELVDLTHALIVEQCNKGAGYPVALSEAHEKAVINGADREQFWRLIEQFVIQDGGELYGSSKQKSKRYRWL